MAVVAHELAEARQQVKAGVSDEALVRAIHGRYTYRMHSLSEFMKGFMQRFTQWFNRSHKRSGGLWEDAFKSVMVEEVFKLCRDRVGAKRTSGARKLRGCGAPAAGTLWCARALRKQIG